MTLKGIKAFILKATKHYNSIKVIMAPFQHGFIDLAQLVNFCYILKLTIKTDVVSKMLGDIWLIAYKIVVLYIALTHILETFFYRFAIMKGVNPSRSHFLLQLEIVNCGVSRHTSRQKRSCLLL